MFHTTKTDKIWIWIIGLIGVSGIIIIHELGHFLAARFFNIPVETFSIGFGPSLLSFVYNSTVFQIALLPLGGFVAINQEVLEQEPYIRKMIVMLAGIVFNIALFFFIIAYRKLRKKEPLSIKKYIAEQLGENRTIIGPIGIITLIGTSFYINKQLFLYLLALISLNIALFNLLPLPFLDGGKALLFTAKEILGSHYPSSLMAVISLVTFFLFIAFTCIVSAGDIKKLSHK